MAGDKLPGVTLWWHSSSIKKAAGPKSTVEVVLTATVEDEEVWKVVQQKLIAGFRVYSINDFKGEMLQAVNEELEKSQAVISGLEHRVRQLEYERGTLRTDLAKKQEVLDKWNELSQMKIG